MFAQTRSHHHPIEGGETVSSGFSITKDRFFVMTTKKLNIFIVNQGKFFLKQVIGFENFLPAEYVALNCYHPAGSDLYIILVLLADKYVLITVGKGEAFYPKLKTNIRGNYVVIDVIKNLFNWEKEKVELLGVTDDVKYILFRVSDDQGSTLRILDDYNESIEVRKLVPYSYFNLLDEELKTHHYLIAEIVKPNTVGNVSLIEIFFDGKKITYRAISEIKNTKENVYFPEAYYNNDYTGAAFAIEYCPPSTLRERTLNLYYQKDCWSYRYTRHAVSPLTYIPEENYEINIDNLDFETVTSFVPDPNSLGQIIVAGKRKGNFAIVFADLIRDRNYAAAISTYVIESTNPMNFLRSSDDEYFLYIKGKEIYALQ